MQVVRAEPLLALHGAAFFLSIFGFLNDAIAHFVPRDGEGPAGTETIRINLHQIRQNIVFNGQESVETSQYLSDRSCWS